MKKQKGVDLMTALASHFNKSESIGIEIAIHAIWAELSTLEALIADPAKASIRFVLNKRRQALKAILQNLKEQAHRGCKMVSPKNTKRDDFLLILFLYYRFQANRAALYYKRQRHNKKMRNRRMPAPRLAA